MVVVRRLMRDDVEPGLPVPQGFDVRAYEDQLVARWHNEAVRHRLAQIAMDGSQKIPNRWFGPIRERLAAGGSPAGHDARTRGVDALRVGADVPTTVTRTSSTTRSASRSPLRCKGSRHPSR